MKIFYEGRPPELTNAERWAKFQRDHMHPNWRRRMVESVVWIITFGLIGYVVSGWIIANKPPPTDRKFEKRWYDRVKPQ